MLMGGAGGWCRGSVCHSEPPEPGATASESQLDACKESADMPTQQPLLLQPCQVLTASCILQIAPNKTFEHVLETLKVTLAAAQQQKQAEAQHRHHHQKAPQPQSRPEVYRRGCCSCLTTNALQSICLCVINASTPSGRMAPCTAGTASREAGHSHQAFRAF